jgi:photosystem II stability/assembly factor-like uncharacterized protein
MKKQLFTLALGVSSLAAFSQASTIWQPYNSNLAPANSIGQLSVVDTNTVWGLDGSSYNMFTRTIDGANFHAGKFNPDTSTYQGASISAVDANTAYITAFRKAQTATNAGQILKTTNGGATWTNMVNTGMYTGSTTAFIDWVHFWDANNGLVFGDPNGSSAGGATAMWEIYRTHDGGTTWTRVADANVPTPLNGDGGLTSSYTTYKHFMWAGTFNGLVLASSDSGKTWTYSNGTNGSIGIDGGCDGLAFRDSIHGLAWGLNTTGGVPTVIRTSDGGATWTPVTMGTSVGFGTMCTIPKTKGYMAVGADSASYSTFSATSPVYTSVTYDDGATWNVLESGTAGDDAVRMLSVQMVDSLNGWAGNFSDTTMPHGLGGANRFHLGHKTGCPIGITAHSSSTPFNVCAGSAITLTASGLNTYTWSTSATTASVSVSPTVTTTYSVAGTTTAGCANYDAFDVTVISGTVTTTAPSHTICPGSNVTLHVSGATTYSWSPSTALTVTTGTASVASPTAAITYTVMGIDNFCPLTPATISIAMKAVPNLTVTASSYSVCGAVGSSTLSAAGANTYTWTTGAGTTISTTSTTVVSPVSTGTATSYMATYTITGNGTATTNCTSKSTITLTVTACSGIEDYSSTSHVSVYPNPSNGLVTVSLANIEANTAMYVTNMIGQQVVSATLKDLNTNFDFSALNKGVYFITVTNGNSKHVEKLIIQ